MKKEGYVERTERHAKKTPLLKHCIAAFLTGGAICAAGHGIVCGLVRLGLEEDAAKKWLPLILIFFASLITGLGWFDRFAKVAGAGLLVPITGFANAMTAPSLDSKAEGLVLGVGAKMFTIAGPVIVYGTVASVVYGVVYWITTLF
ncbi:MAG: SpoVA/SpoVAEb family sporulation membrane protein [Clostridia bacterium]|nr:SpoVA/SpoVAEb family sporulation membrane protein [Clostridia bacterium]